MAFVMTSPTLIAGYNRREVARGPAIPLPVSSLASKAVEAADVLAGNVAVTLGSDGKVSNLAIAASIEILGAVTEVSSGGTYNATTGQTTPDLAFVEIAKPGAVLDFKYWTVDAPAKGDRVILASKASVAGKVAKAPKGTGFDTVFSADTYMYKSFVPNVVIDVDTTNYECSVLFLPGGMIKA